MSYRATLILTVTLLVVLTGLSVTIFNVRRAREMADELAGTLFREATTHAAVQARDFLSRATPVAKVVAGLAGRGLELEDQDRLARQLLVVLQANRGLGWVSYSDEAGSFTGAYRTEEGKFRINQSHIESGKTRLVEYDVNEDGTWGVYRREDDSGYDPRVRAFYGAAKEAGQVVWLPPYVFFGQGLPGITCAMPVYNDGKQFTGVVTVDFDLHTLSKHAVASQLSPDAKLMIFAPDGTVLAHPTARLSTPDHKRNEGELLKIDQIADPLAAAMFRELNPRELDGSDPSHSFRQIGFEHEGRAYYGAARTLRLDPGLVWIVGAVAPQSDFLDSVWQSQRVSLLISLGCVLAAMLLAAALARKVSDPIVSMAGFMRRVGAGELGERAYFGRMSEFRRLSEALNQMIADLREGMRMRTSLAVANDVQQRLLPARPPCVRGLDIAGHSSYCDETGGDYYDFLPHADDPHKLLVAIGDVMGHGVGSALLMAGARGILRSRARGSADLAELLSHLNAQLLADTGGRRFMTLYVADVDTRDASVRWASAGHDPAIVYDPHDDRFFELAGGDLPLGIEPETDYQQFSHELREGQTIVIGTDGVWDAHNAEGEYFGKGRLREAVRSAATGTSAEIAAAINRTWGEFRGSERQRDDATFVVVKVLTLGAGTEERPDVAAPATVA